MSVITPIAMIALLVAASTTLAISHHQGWGAFGDIQQGIADTTTCKAQIIHIGWSKGAASRSTAETRALIGWSQRANRHGSAYTSWHNASSRTVKCQTHAGNNTKCIVRGRPCKQKAHTVSNALF